MVIDDFTDRKPGDIVYIAGTGYTLVRIVGVEAYATRQGTAATKTYVIRPEGKLFTVSELRGDRTMAWSYCGAMHRLEPV